MSTFAITWDQAARDPITFHIPAALGESVILALLRDAVEQERPATISFTHCEDVPFDPFNETHVRSIEDALARTSMEWPTEP